jgi:hypothetical protein
MLILLIAFLQEICKSHYTYNLSDPESMLNYSYAKRDYFERTGRWKGSSYNPSKWDDRVQVSIPQEDLHVTMYAEATRKLQATSSDSTLTCKDGVTVCPAKQTCLDCLCTILAKSQYLGGYVFMANGECIWSNCKCGVAR